MINAQSDNPIFILLSGHFDAAAFAARHDIHIMKEDQYYIYIEATTKDKTDYEKVILVLFNDMVKDMAYLPAKVQFKRRNDEVIEEWTVKQPMANPKGITEKDFKYVEPPKDWKKLTVK